MFVFFHTFANYYALIYTNSLKQYEFSYSTYCNWFANRFCSAGFPAKGQEQKGKETECHRMQSHRLAIGFLGSI